MCFFLMMCTLCYGQLFLVSIFCQLTSEKNEVHTDNLIHCRQTLQLINPLTHTVTKTEFLLTISIQYQSDK